MVKPLTAKQTIKAIALAKKGLSQYKIGIALKRRKEDVGIALRAAKVGKRTTTPFMTDASALYKMDKKLGVIGTTWRSTMEKLTHYPKYAERRAKSHGKKYKTYRDFWDEIDEKYAEMSKSERMRRGHEELEEEMEDTEFDTVR